MKTTAFVVGFVIILLAIAFAGFLVFGGFHGTTAETRVTGQVSHPSSEGEALRTQPQTAPMDEDQSARLAMAREEALWARGTNRPTAETTKTPPINWSAIMQPGGGGMGPPPVQPKTRLETLPKTGLIISIEKRASIPVIRSSGAIGDKDGVRLSQAGLAIGRSGVVVSATSSGTTVEFTPEEAEAVAKALSETDSIAQGMTSNGVASSQDRDAGNFMLRFDFSRSSGFLVIIARKPGGTGLFLRREDAIEFSNKCSDAVKQAALIDSKIKP